VRAGLKWLVLFLPRRQLTCSWVITKPKELPHPHPHPWMLLWFFVCCRLYFFAKARLRCKAELMGAISYTLCAMDAINLLISRTRRGSIHSGHSVVLIPSLYASVAVQKIKERALKNKEKDGTTRPR